jgi:excisionase family DNA binding protein
MRQKSNPASTSSNAFFEASGSSLTLAESPDTNAFRAHIRGYRIAEAAAYMGVSPWFVELKIRSGELPALRLCRHYTVLKEDMDEFLNKERAAIKRQIHAVKPQKEVVYE